MIGAGPTRLALAATLLAGTLLATAGCDPAPSPGTSGARATGSGTPGAGTSGTATSGAAGTPGAAGAAGPTPSSTGLRSGNDPTVYAGPVKAWARTTGVHAQLLMAILFNESDKPHDPALERAWLKLKPDAALGIANMHRAAFDDTKRGRDFARRNWLELPDDPELAIEAAAWYLHDLGTRLPGRVNARYTRDELLALGYNAGPANMLAFARGQAPGPLAAGYLQRLRDHWTAAGTALR